MGFPTRLYHYTSSAVLLSIIKNKSIWLSGRWHLNDYDEGRVFNRIMRERAEKNQAGKADEIIDSLEELDFYVNCMTPHEDMLSQWRGYAGDGSGVSIGFNTSFILDAIKGSTEALLYPVEYADKFSELSKKKSEFIETLLKSNGSPSHEFLQSATKERWSVKGKGFKEEEEYRLIVTPNDSGRPIKFNDGVEASISYRATENEIRDYYELSFKNLGAVKLGGIIDSLVLGPKNNSNIDTVERLLYAQGFRNVDVRRSKTTYR